MTTEEILKLAREAGFDGYWRKEEIKEYPNVRGMMVLELTEAVSKFAALVAAAEREECAKICDALHDSWKWDEMEDSESGPRECAASIRNREAMKL